MQNTCTKQYIPGYPHIGLQLLSGYEDVQRTDFLDRPKSRDLLAFIYRPALWQQALMPNDIVAQPRLGVERRKRIEMRSGVSGGELLAWCK